MILPDKLEVTGFPLDLKRLDKYRNQKKENIVKFYLLLVGTLLVPQDSPSGALDRNKVNRNRLFI